MSQSSSIDTLIKKLDGLLQNRLLSFVIAIDGDAASGKTTLAEFLSKRYESILVHTDQFYLPFDKRSSDPAGHMNIKKIIHEVLIPHALGKEIEFAWFDPHLGYNRDAIRHDFRPVIILEGSYSMHPDILPYLDYKIFLKIPEDVQDQRILNRSNLKVLEAFKAQWIPKEKTYQETYNIQSFADTMIDTATFTLKEIL